MLTYGSTFAAKGASVEVDRLTVGSRPLFGQKGDRMS
jgi:hypothetical protein